jgi:two-component system LytT family response regulator
MTSLRAIIVDDEPLAREKLRTFLEQEPQVEVVAECTGGSEALEAIAREEPDVVFLDVQMPEMDGFEVLDRLAEDERPMVVFVTAYDRYALRAFDVHAVDYLLKPFDRERLRKAVELVRARHDGHSAHELGEQLSSLLRQLRQERRVPDRIAIRSSGRVVFVRLDEIDWIEAAGNYVRLHVGAKNHLLRDTMTALEKRLDDRFLRIHRSSIVNVERIRELEPLPSGEYTVTLLDGTKLTLSRGYRDRVAQLVRGE